jgi:ribulose-5-phosphate 4-epimerase/fuculose-1-phosphate aldolase
MQDNIHKLSTPFSDEILWQLRVDLAACFRLISSYGWTESVANHFSVAVSEDGTQFLMNPKWQHFATIKASDLQLFDSNDQQTMEKQNAPDPSAWCIHSKIHASLPRAKVLLHCHPPYATTLTSLKDPSIKPIDQNTARFYNRVSIDLGFDGLANRDEEGDRLAAAFGDHNVLLMGNHGVTVSGTGVAQAFEDLYYLERACRTMILAYQTGQPLSVMSDQLAEKTAQGWDLYLGIADAHFHQLKKILDRTDPDYAT